MRLAKGSLAEFVCAKASLITKKPDSVSFEMAAENQRAMTKSGTYVIVGFGSLFKMFSAKLKGKREDSQVKLHLPVFKNNEDLLFLCDLMQRGRLIPKIDRTYDLTEVPEAQLYLESKKASGKVVIRVNK